jgi:hypothetical protein
MRRSSSFLHCLQKNGVSVQLCRFGGPAGDEQLQSIGGRTEEQLITSAVADLEHDTGESCLAWRIIIAITDMRGLAKTSGVGYLRIRAESSNKSEIVKQANHAAASGQLNQHRRPVLEDYWKRPHEPLPSPVNVENTDDPAEREKSRYQYIVKLLKADWYTTMDTRLHIPHVGYSQGRERSRKSQKLSFDRRGRVQ